MPTSTGHTTAILASKVQGTSVYNQTGDKIGHVEDVVLDKVSNQIMFAVLGFGGFLGAGEKYYPVPWSALDYSKEEGGYVIPMDKETLENAPSYDIDDLIKGDGASSDIRATTYDYYKVQPYW
jgi:sporulation protein YlmC with PRC-barrel domain